MAKQLDYYAGYPNQQSMPKWVGITLGSLFGGLMVVALALAIRLVMPARTAEASVAPRPAPTAEPAVAPRPDAPVAVAAAEPASQLGVASYSSRSHHRGHHGKAAVAHVAKVKLAKADPRYRKAQLYAKSVSSSRRDKRSRDELDKLLGL